MLCMRSYSRCCFFLCLLLSEVLNIAAQKPFEEPHVPKRIENKVYYREGYIVGYNKDLRVPNFVAWRLTREHTNGPQKRLQNFMEDMDVPIPRATPQDYKGSGWSRGHLCPAGDNKWDFKAMYDTFLMTNVCPQHAALNTGMWNQIEMLCRQWANKYGEVYIVCGPIFYKKNEIRTIGPNKVAVPDAFFKVVLCLDVRPKAIGFICKNAALDGKKHDYVNSVREVERITEFDFFPLIDKSVQDMVENMNDLKEW